MDFNFLLGEDCEIIDDDRLYVINGGSCTSGGAGSAAPSGVGGSGSTSTPSGCSSATTTTSTQTETGTGYSEGNITGRGYPSSNSGYGQGYNSEPKDPTLDYEAGYVVDKEGAAWFGHGGMFVKTKFGYSFFEVNGLEGFDAKAESEEYKIKVEVLSNSLIKFPSAALLGKIKKDTCAGVIRRDFETKETMLDYLKKSGREGYDKINEFKISETQANQIFDRAMELGKSFVDYSLIGNSCGTWAASILNISGSGINQNIPFSSIPYSITNMLFSNAPNLIYYTLESTYQPNESYRIIK